MSELAPLSLIVAYSTAERAIGRDGDLPWHEPEDLAWFKAKTLGRAIIHGRRSYEALGRPLPKRRNIVITRTEDYSAPGCEVVDSLGAAIDLARESDPCPMICGGSGIYRASLPLVTTCFLTEIDRSVPDADTFFPDMDESLFEETERSVSGRCTFRVLERR
jgi:dihydrofolate reductase